MGTCVITVRKTETNLQMLRLTNSRLPNEKRGGERDKSGAWDEHTYTTIYKTDNRREPAV